MSARRIRLDMARPALSFLVLFCGVACHQRARQELDPAIGPPVREKYRAVRDGKDWMNPFLQVYEQGVDLHVGPVKQFRTVPIAALRDTLLALPSAAWPYGRIVAVQDCSIGVPGDRDERRARMRAVASILNGLELEADYWPS